MRALATSFLLAGALLIGGGGCDEKHMATGSAGVAGDSGGTGDAGAGGGAGTTSACASATGAGGTGGEAPAPSGTPQEINDALLNAPTTGGIDVTRTAPTSMYPTCQ